MLEGSLSYVMGNLGISREQAMQVYDSLMMSEKTTFEEHIATVLMACSAFENMLKELVIDLGIQKGIPADEAENIVEEITTPSGIFQQFKLWAGKKFDLIVEDANLVEFKIRWFDDIRDKRNDFMHGVPDAIERPTAATTYVLLPQLVAFFVALRNYLAPKTA